MKLSIKMTALLILPLFNIYGAEKPITKVSDLCKSEAYLEIVSSHLKKNPSPQVSELSRITSVVDDCVTICQYYYSVPDDCEGSWRSISVSTKTGKISSDDTYLAWCEY